VDGPVCGGVDASRGVVKSRRRLASRYGAIRRALDPFKLDSVVIAAVVVVVDEDASLDVCSGNGTLPMR